MEPLAYGPLELKPWEFAKLQPQEFEKMLEGYTLRRDRDNELRAYFTCLLIAPHVKKDSITVEKILKPLQPHKVKQVTQQEKAYFQRMAEQMEAKKRGGE